MFWDDDFWDLDLEDFAFIGATIGLLEEERDEEPVAEDSEEDENEPTT